MKSSSSKNQKIRIQNEMRTFYLRSERKWSQLTPENKGERSVSAQLWGDFFEKFGQFSTQTDAKKSNNSI